MSELSAATGVPVATVKFYLREGLLPPGERTHPNQARYDSRHVRRLRLIRALTEVADLGLAAVAKVIAAIDGDLPVQAALGAAQDALAMSSRQERPSETSSAVLDEVIRRRGWEVLPASPARRLGDEAIAAVEAADLPGVLERIDDYAAAAEAVARADLDSLRGLQHDEDLVHAAAVGTVLRRPLLDALVLLAQQHETNRRERLGGIAAE
jgi:DNA-binding transcriptional MerR regulator